MASTIILSDNGASSGSAGIKTTGGNDGTLQLQTTTSGGTATTALTIDTSQNTTLSGNAVINKASPLLSLEDTTGGGNNYGIRSSGALFRIRDTTSAADIAYMNAGGTFILKGGNTSATGTGITFPATQSASSDANTLDDYEEGGWTPTINFNGSSTGVTYSAAEGTYTKIGRMVTVNGVISLSNHGSATGNAFIGGLPFTVGNLLTPTGLEASGLFGYFANLGSSVACLMLDAIEGTTTVGIYYVPAAGANNVTAATQTLIANTFDCRFSITYFT